MLNYSVTFFLETTTPAQPTTATAPNAAIGATSPVLGDVFVVAFVVALLSFLSAAAAVVALSFLSAGAAAGLYRRRFADHHKLRPAETKISVCRLSDQNG